MMVKTREFTPAEAAALVDLSEKEVRKEIGYRVIDWDVLSARKEDGQLISSSSSLRLPFAALVYLYLVRRSSLSLRSRERNAIYKRIVLTMSQDEVPEQIEVTDPFYLRLGAGVTFLDDKVSRFLL